LHHNIHVTVGAFDGTYKVDVRPVRVIQGAFGTGAQLVEPCREPPVEDERKLTCQSVGTRAAERSV
jgi:hypothetical protein